MAVTHPLEDLPSSLNTELEEAWGRFRHLRLFEIRVLQAEYRKEICASSDDGRQKKCRLAVLEALECWKQQKQKGVPAWTLPSTEHLKIVRGYLAKHGLVATNMKTVASDTLPV